MNPEQCLTPHKRVNVNSALAKSAKLKNSTPIKVLYIRKMQNFQNGLIYGEDNLKIGMGSCCKGITEIQVSINLMSLG